MVGGWRRLGIDGQEPDVWCTDRLIADLSIVVVHQLLFFDRDRRHVLEYLEMVARAVTVNLVKGL